MAKQAPVEKAPEPPVEREQRNALYETLRKVLLAGIGAVAIAQEEIDDLVEKLVERGEIAEKDGKKLIHEINEKRKHESKKTEDQVSKRIEDALDRLNVPRKSDIDALGEKINELSAKVDELKKS
ncbi:MAG TPA: poly(hydroxyalkanoate) granule-associated protein [Bacteroidetes bacterium]|jgi:poly(hydroxyalkanoate) granule-associated protein|nr:poly(hydroxyalkanoate) granule-associated protein [Bacteroidota bacterium]